MPDIRRQFYNGLTERNEVWLSCETTEHAWEGRVWTEQFWLVWDIDSKGQCAKHLLFSEALLDYEQRVRQRTHVGGI